MSASSDTAPVETRGSAQPRWLGPDEMAAWLQLVQVVYRLPQALDHLLREEVGISHLYYQMLAMLSERPERTATMGELSELTMTKPSRLSHAVAALERQGWVVRRRCEHDRRVQHATLTGAGLATLEEIAPTHVRQVRELVFDRLEPDDVHALQRIMGQLLEGLAEGATGDGSAISGR